MVEGARGRQILVVDDDVHVRELCTRVLSNEGYHDIAIDNFQVTAVPAPGALLLGGLGASLVGYLRRRKTL